MGIRHVRVLIAVDLGLLLALLVGVGVGYRPFGDGVGNGPVRQDLEPILFGGASLLVLVTTGLALVMLWRQDRQVSRARSDTARGDRRFALVGLRSPAVVVPVVVLLLFGGMAAALFTGSDTVTGNQFGTGCFDAQIEAVQQGAVTNSAEGVQTVTITAVEPTRSVAFISVRSNSAAPADSMILAELASATQLNLTRRTDNPSPPSITVNWTVVEYRCGVTVQRGTTAGNGLSTMDVAVTEAPTANSFVVTSAVTDRSDAAHDGDDDHLATLIGSTTLRFSTATGGALPTNHDYGWQVVTFDDPADAQVQRGTVTLTATNSETITLTTAVDPATTMVLATAAGAGTGSDIGERLARVHLSSSTTVEVTRLLAGDALEVAVQVIDFGDGTVVQHGVLNMAAAATTAAVTVGPVDTGRTSALSTINGPGSVSGGASDMAASAVLGEAAATFTVTDATTVTVQRAASAAAASFGWQLVQWGGPAWWDTDYPFRQRIDVTTTSTAAPDDYTVSVVVDHLDLVNSGLSLSGGGDLRILRWDGSAWVELNRVLDDNSSWGSATTTLWFRTTDPIGTASTDSYWLYFGNGSPAAAADDPEEVWLLHEDFESGTLGDFEDVTAGTTWYGADAWSARIPLVVQSSLVDADLLDFRVYVEFTSAALGAGAAADGADIRFTTDDGVTGIPHELESWDAGTGTVKAWVRVPRVSSSADTTLYLFYGAADSPDRQDPGQVWRHSAGVWHLSRDPGGHGPHLEDSSVAGRDGLSVGSMGAGDLVAGRTGLGLDLDGIDDGLVAQPFEVVGKTLTASGWVRLDSVTGDQVIVAKANSATDRILALGTTGTQAVFEVRAGSSTTTVTGGTIGTGTWHHVAGTWNGVALDLYVDGVWVATTGATGDPGRDAAMPVTLGVLDDGTRPLDGVLDEVRLETTTRTDDWLLATYRNQSNPAAFVVAGASQSVTAFDQGSWTYRKPLAVLAQSVDATLTDQPVLVDIVDPELVGNIQTDGDDVVFTAADGSTRLDHQLESVDAATGAVTAWVRLPSLSADAATPFFVYFGNGTAEDQQDPAGVFGPTSDLVVHGS
ncbi:MAG: DUF2341 domain-containing protein [Actinomycetota bacterium]